MARNQGMDTAEGKSRKNSVSHTLQKTDQLHHRKDLLKLKMDEFCVDVDFQLGVPMIILDIIHALTGHNFVQEVQSIAGGTETIVRQDPDSYELMRFKDNLVEEV